MTMPSPQNADVWLHIIKEDPDGHRSEWTVETRGLHLLLTAPDGNAFEVSTDADALKNLASLSAADPDMAILRRNQRVWVTCDGAVRDLLPLWLSPSSEEVPGVLVDGQYAGVIEGFMNIDVSFGHELFVNREPWLVVISQPYEQGDPDTRLLAVPRNGTTAEELSYQDFAGYAWTETGSMTSGHDSSIIGLLTPAVIVMLDVLDEDPVLISIRRFTDPVSAVRIWLECSYMTSELGNLWRDAGVDSNFIADGLLRLSIEVEGEVKVWGPFDEDSLFSDDAVYREGLTETCVWTFFGSLTPSQWAEVLTVSS